MSGGYREVGECVGGGGGSVWKRKVGVYPADAGEGAVELAHVRPLKRRYVNADAAGSGAHDGRVWSRINTWVGCVGKNVDVLLKTGSVIKSLAENDSWRRATRLEILQRCGRRIRRIRYAHSYRTGRGGVSGSVGGHCRNGIRSIGHGRRGPRPLIRAGRQRV